jgi:hypothetical protein
MGPTIHAAVMANLYCNLLTLKRYSKSVSHINTAPVPTFLSINMAIAMVK